MNKDDLNKQSHRMNGTLALGVFVMVLSSICWTLMSIMVKAISTVVSTNIIVFARFSMGLLFIFPFIALNLKENLFIKKPLIVMGRSLSGFAVVFCFYYSIKYISISDALVLNNSFPLFVPIIIYLTTRYTTPAKVWASIVLGFLGVMLVIKPTSGLFHPAALVALLSALFAAASIVIIQLLATTYTTIQILFYNFLIGTIISGISLAFYEFSFTWEALPGLLGIGLISTIYQWLLTFALRSLSSNIVAPLTYLSIPLGMMADYLFWGKSLSLVSIFGIILIILGGIFTVWFQDKPNNGR